MCFYNRSMLRDCSQLGQHWQDLSNDTRNFTQRIWTTHWMCRSVVPAMYRDTMIVTSALVFLTYGILQGSRALAKLYTEYLPTFKQVWGAPGLDNSAADARLGRARRAIYSSPSLRIVDLIKLANHCECEFFFLHWVATCRMIRTTDSNTQECQCGYSCTHEYCVVRLICLWTAAHAQVHQRTWTWK